MERALAITGAGLNFLYTGRRRRPVPKRPTALHRQVYERLLVQLCAVLGAVTSPDGGEAASGAFARFVGRDDLLKFPKLEADKVDVSTACGHLDPLESMESAAATLLRSPDLLFEERAGSLPKVSAFRAGRREEYVKLLKRQLRVGKVGLSTHPRATAGVFAANEQGRPFAARSLGRLLGHGGGVPSSKAATPREPVRSC